MMGVRTMGTGLGPDTTRVPHVGTVVALGIGIEQFSVEARAIHTNPIPLTHDRREVTNHHNFIAWSLPTPEERQHAVLPVVEFQPFKPAPVKIELMKGRLFFVNSIEVGDQALNAAVRVPLKQVSLHGVIMRPLFPLGNLATHEQ